MTVEEKLQSMGLALPQAPNPVASYVPAVRTGNLVFTAGQLPYVNGKLPRTGRVGRDVSPDDAYQDARIAALNALAAIATIIDIDRVKRIVRVNGYVNSADEFTGQPAVINGASDLLLEVFGEEGRHSRAAIGVYQLPLGAPVELDLVVEVGY